MEDAEPARSGVDAAGGGTFPLFAPKTCCWPFPPPYPPLPPPYPPLPQPTPYPPPAPPLFPSQNLPPYPPLPAAYYYYVSSTASSLPLIPANSETKFKTLKSRLDETFTSARSHPKPETLNPNPKPRTAKELVLYQANSSTARQNQKVGFRVSRVLIYLYCKCNP